MTASQNARLKIDTYQLITDKVIELLEKGVCPWRNPMIASGVSPINAVSKKPYNGINNILLQCLPFEKPIFVTFKQALTLKGKVKKGEKGFPVIYWDFFQKEKDKSQYLQELQHNKNAKPYDFIPFLKHYTVFNIAQCENLEKCNSLLKDTERRTNNQPIETAESIINGMPNKPEIKNIALHSAYYSPKEDYINVPTIDYFEIEQEYYSTIFHEMGHSTGHQSRLNRKSVTDCDKFGSPKYAYEELIAEFTSAFLCGESGILPKTIDNSSSYIGGWVKKLSDDKKLLVQAASNARKAANYILNAENQ